MICSTRLVLLFSLLIFSGCVQTVSLTTPFNPAEHAFAKKPGSATISAQAFMRRNDGVVVYAAGSPAYLLPDTSYTREIYNKASTTYLPVNLTNADHRLVDYSRQTQANGEGRFAFSNIPEGRYLIVTGVSWMAGNYRQGGDLTQYVEVRGGKNVDVIVTR